MDSAKNATNRSDDDWGLSDSVLGYSSLVPAMGISFWGGRVGNQRPRGTARHSLPKGFSSEIKQKKKQ